MTEKDTAAGAVGHGFVRVFEHIVDTDGPRKGGRDTENDPIWRKNFVPFYTGKQEGQSYSLFLWPGIGIRN